jgi:hypothetical protein
VPVSDELASPGWSKVTDGARKGELGSFGSLFTTAHDRDGPAVGVGEAERAASRSKLESTILSRRFARPTPSAPPDFDCIPHGYDTAQVDSYLAELLGWANQQALRAGSAEQTLRAVVAHLCQLTDQPELYPLRRKPD